MLAAREADLAGATVLRGLMGYGRHSRVHAAKILRLSEELPTVGRKVTEGLVTLEKVRVLKYRGG